MSRKAVDDLAARINREIDYCRREFEMTYAEAVGVLQVVTFELLQEATKDEGHQDAGQRIEDEKKYRQPGKPEKNLSFSAHFSLFASPPLSMAVARRLHSTT